MRIGTTLILSSQEFSGRRTLGTPSTEEGPRLVLRTPHITELHKAAHKKSLPEMWVLVLLAACATAAHGQLDSTLGDVLGAIA